MDPQLAAHKDLAALERFVVDNEDLQTLEELIGRFNIFDALGVARAEVRHSNFLGWLLDPGESHGQFDLFLKALLMDIARCAREQGIAPAFSPVELDGTDLGRTEVRREWRNIDLVIQCPQPDLVVVIENKIDSGEHSDQLARYRAIVREAFPRRPVTHVFLTPDRTLASEDGWVAYSYEDIHRVFSRISRTNGGSIGKDVATFLEHYLRLVGSRMMNDPTIDELCRKIYKNHRAAIDLIVERAGVGGNAVLNQVAEIIKLDPRWTWINTTSKWVFFMPKPLRETLKPIGRRAQYDPREWLILSINWDPRGKLTAGFTVWPTSDDALRRKVLDRITRDRSEFGLRKKGAGDGGWTTLMKDPILELDPDAPEESGEALETRMKQTLDTLWARFQHLHITVAEVIESRGE